MKIQKIVMTAALLGLSAPALAHGASSTGGFWQGILHPLTGLDHLVAVICLGAWLSTLSRRVALKSVLAVVALFFTSIVLAGTIDGAQLKLVEVSVLASVVVIGVLMFARTQLGALTPIVAAVLFVVHGLAHSTEVVGGLYSFAGGASLSVAGLALVSYFFAKSVAFFCTKWA
ncbi:HupE/UreJ family protein [Marinagarivorans cellulosilyticus]|uniref:Urease accessory protein n=1 Tax=Marinagarivorans cellulosilyticus TaxID=2721545 RepID=A0AAN1WGY5_9GAMM|nr:HupE/UreJ family protein [Marinagarivorans cellulosilyticus]BCD97407.1 urease accessory protein [Marinagarivorans cellulosilyticus]